MPKKNEEFKTIKYKYFEKSLEANITQLQYEKELLDGELFDELKEGGDSKFKFKFNSLNLYNTDNEDLKKAQPKRDEVYHSVLHPVHAVLLGNRLEVAQGGDKAKNASALEAIAVEAEILELIESIAHYDAKELEELYIYMLIDEFVDGFVDGFPVVLDTNLIAALSVNPSEEASGKPSVKPSEEASENPSDLYASLAKKLHAFLVSIDVMDLHKKEGGQYTPPLTTRDMVQCLLLKTLTKEIIKSKKELNVEELKPEIAIKIQDFVKYLPQKEIETDAEIAERKKVLKMLYISNKMIKLFKKQFDKDIKSEKADIEQFKTQFDKDIKSEKADIKLGKTQFDKDIESEKADIKQFKERLDKDNVVKKPEITINLAEIESIKQYLDSPLSRKMAQPRHQEGAAAAAAVDAVDAFDQIAKQHNLSDKDKNIKNEKFIAFYYHLMEDKLISNTDSQVDKDEQKQAIKEAIINSNISNISIQSVDEAIQQLEPDDDQVAQQKVEEQQKQINTEFTKFVGEFVGEYNTEKDRIKNLTGTEKEKYKNHKRFSISVIKGQNIPTEIFNEESEFFKKELILNSLQVADGEPTTNIGTLFLEVKNEIENYFNPEDADEAAEELAVAVAVDAGVKGREVRGKDDAGAGPGMDEGGVVEEVGGGGRRNQTGGGKFKKSMLKKTNKLLVYIAQIKANRIQRKIWNHAIRNPKKYSIEDHIIYATSWTLYNCYGFNKMLNYKLCKTYKPIVEMGGEMLQDICEMFGI